MDMFRFYQKSFFGNGTDRKMGPYGCPCCAVYGRNYLKKLARNIAREKLKQHDRRNIHGIAIEEI